MNMVSIKINEFINDVPFPEKKRLTNKEYVVILLDIPSNEIYNSNVYVYNIQGEFLWNVSDVLIKKYQTMTDSPFVDIQFDINEDLVLYNWSGWKVIVDSGTGLEKYYELTK